ncbi:MAG: phosphate ABC transporter permease subunit PstC [Alphaproteobacteria bacterium]|nr:phosphate ABC transporter permease subunit PstC [Alphaproteobacteria bacterium]PPR14116.1 MAG: Phosphate transport system permease protein PstC 1 [Alphaproteobacteria bacterium MarineAlpha12_Bin1]|tara:strand:- start:3905 stop:5287 length:1383 start_codon:yes stop_codon:yes gene_type:complete
MNTFILITVLLLFMVFSYQIGKKRVLKTASSENIKLHSLPGYYGVYIAVLCGLPALFLTGVWLSLENQILELILLSELPNKISSLSAGEIDLLVNDIRNVASNNISSREPSESVLSAALRYNQLKSISLFSLAVSCLVVCILGLSIGLKKLDPTLRARPIVEGVARWTLLIASIIAVLTTIGIVLSLIFESIRFFEVVSPLEFLFGLNWSPQTALREDQIGASGAFGAVPIFAGTLLITLIAMLVSVPVGLLSAIYMAEYASSQVRGIVKPVLEILAGIPTVVYGFFAALTIGPSLRGFGDSLGLGVASESALVAGLVMGVMIIPFVSSLSDDVINAVPQSLRDGAYALGATESETVRQVVLPAALHGIVGAILLAVSRAIGETMIVVMAAGLAANLTANPFEAVTTVTVQIVTLLVGDQEFDSAKTLAAFALGLVLFLVTLVLNVIALVVVRRYREEYE